MITSKEDYLFYLEADRIALNEKNKKPPIIGHNIWKYQRLLRKAEYYNNCRNHFPWKLYLLYLQGKLYYSGIFLGYTMSMNTFGPGLSIAHIGTIVVNGNVKIGENCRIHTCVNIGTQGGKRQNGEPDKVPIIGNNVYIGPGVKIFGDISLADNIAIGANAVVNKSFTEPGITIAGVPAKKISDKGSRGLIINATGILKDRL
jgi:serine O-acetyltransferase